MKKLIAALLILASAVSFASCSVNKRELTFEERQASIEARESEKAAESLKHEAEIAEEMSELEDEIGKTVKGKRIVIKSVYTDRTEYGVLEFDKDQKLKSRREYMYFSDESDYNVVKNNKGLREDLKLVKDDKNSRLLVFEHKNIDGSTFDEWYSNFKTFNYDIVE